MFEDVEALSFEGANQLALRVKRGHVFKLERDMVQLVLNAKSVQVTTAIMCENSWHDPEDLDGPGVTSIFEQPEMLKRTPYPVVRLGSVAESMYATADATPENAKVFCFAKSNFLGPVEGFRIRIVAGPNPLCRTAVYDRDLLVSCILTEEVFARLLKHLYLSAADFEMRLVVGFIGFQSQSEAAFSDIGDISNLVLESGRGISSEIRSISITKRALS
ncbi:hypothetical protein [Bosea sp. BK604]|uniref:hypothetical protein n=1 Tax=Bosea sp. BK604 TaxID=2512180 RepID=UPI00105202A1|nr:hypothetical protein [Bosea sp. BK604]TCR62949.1 hypothetical protein EV560_10942 [Bosea sp. BK604]